MIKFKNLVVTALAVGALASSAMALGFTKKSELGGFDGFVERMGGGVRELGRGNTGTADTATMPAAYWNPALLGFREDIGITMNFEKRDLDRVGGAFGIEGKVGKRMGVGFAMLYRGDSDFKVIDDDDETLGSAEPFFSMFYLGFAFRATRRDAFGLSLSMSYDNLDVAKYFDGIEMEDSFRSPVTINLSFSRNLSARWTKNPSKDNSLASTEGVRPKVLQIGLGYRTTFFGKNVNAWMEAIDYQVADTLLAFDPQLHVWTGRVGFECEVIPNGTLRVGMDDLDWMFGAGYKFDIRVGRKRFPIEVDYAFLYETRAGIWTPFTIGLRGYIP